MTTDEGAYPHDGAVDTRDRKRPHRPRLTAGRRGYVRVQLPAMLAVLERLSKGSSPTVAMADLAELLVLLVDAAGTDGRIAPPGGWTRESVAGYHHRLISPDGWEPRRGRLVDAGLLVTDEWGRVVRIDPAWHLRLTTVEATARDGGTETIPFVALQRDVLRELVGLLRDQCDDRGRARPGIGRLLTLLVVLCAPTVSAGMGGAVRLTQGALADRLGITRQTINSLMRELGRLELVSPAQRNRSGRGTTDVHLAHVAARDRLAGRTWQPSEASDRPAAEAASARVLPAQGVKKHPASCQEAPPARRGVAEGLPPSSGQSSKAPHVATADTAKGGSRLPVGDWPLGPDTTAPGWTRHAIARLAWNAPALRELLQRSRDKRLGGAVRAAVDSALERAEQVTAQFDAIGQLPDSDDRALVEAVARLCRTADAIVRTGGDAAPALTCEDPDPHAEGAATWFDDAGQLRPLPTVVLLATRLKPYHKHAMATPRYQQTAGNWRKRERPSTALATARGQDLPPVELHATMALLGEHLSGKTRRSARQAAPEWAASAVTDTVRIATDPAEQPALRLNARRLLSRWMLDADLPGDSDPYRPTTQEKLAQWMCDHAAHEAHLVGRLLNGAAPA